MPLSDSMRGFTLNRFRTLTLGALLSVAAPAVLSGCGNTAYAVKINQANGSYEEARTLGAEKNAPYEFYSAQVRLEEARRQAAHADYGDAIRLAKEAESFALQAIQKTKGQDGSLDAAPSASAGGEL